MSKKLAAGADSIVLDVKTGSGAFMKKKEDSFALAKEMVTIGTNAGRHTVAVISNMDQPLGYAVGNALEVKEAIDTLNDKGPDDFKELCMTLGSYMLLSGKKAASVKEARDMLQEAISSGRALDKLAQFIESQGGNKNQVYHPETLPTASICREIKAKKDGYISHIDCDEIGICSLILGGGREKKDSPIDLSVGLILHKKTGDFVQVGDVLATIYANDEEKLTLAKERFLKAYHFSDTVPEKQVMIQGIIE